MNTVPGSADSRSTAVNTVPGVPEEPAASSPVSSGAPNEAQGLIPLGTVIDGYLVESVFSAKGGESYLYLCQNQSNPRRRAILKLFVRDLSEEEITSRAKVIENLSQIRKGVVRILSSGSYQGRLYEIIPYYSKGSLKDRMEKKLFTEEEIRSSVLPELVKIFKRIHAKGIIHADIKPDNIMYDWQGNLVLIDFGVSRVASNGTTTIVDVVGGTPDYQAPEMKTGILLAETDYYALGITLYTLITGQTPTQYLRSVSDVERARMLGRIPHPDGMSDEFYKLLYYLTFLMIQERRSRGSHMTRWTAEEVEQWLTDGCPQWPAPGKSEESARLSQRELPINIRFNGRIYETLDELLFAMAGDWDHGRHFLLRKSDGLAQLLDRQAERNPKLRGLAEEISLYRRQLLDNDYTQDLALFRFVYHFGKDYDVLFWKGGAYRTMEQLGQAIIVDTEQRQNLNSSPYLPIFQQGLIQIYLAQKPEPTAHEQKLVKKLDEVDTQGFKHADMIRLAYMLMETPVLEYAPGAPGLRKPADLKKLLAGQHKDFDMDAFRELCGCFIKEDGSLNDRTKGWLAAHGVRAK